MAIKHQLTLDELAEVVTEYVDSNKLAITTFEETHDNLVGLLDTIGAIVTLDTGFVDKLPELDGNNLPLGKTIEEYFQDLILPFDQGDVDDGEENTLKFYSPTYRPVSYNYRFGTKTIAQSIKNYDVERAVNNSVQLGNIIATQYKRMTDSSLTYRYEIKRELLGKVGELIDTAYANATAWSSSAELVEGKWYSHSAGDTEYNVPSTYGDGTKCYAVCVKSKPAGTTLTWQDAIKQGYIVISHMYIKIKVPKDEETGEAFIEKVKQVLEISRDVSDGYSLNGNTIGAEKGLSFYLRQGILPNLEVKTKAQVYHLDQLGFGMEAKVIKDFGSNPSGMFGILCDTRGVKLHLDYDAMREQRNALKDFFTLFHHTDYTGFISRNTFFCIFVADTSEDTESTSASKPTSDTTGN